MQSKRKPYFAGNTVPLKGETGGILYNRYTDLGEILLEPEVKTDGPPALTFEGNEKKEKKSKKRKDQEDPKPDAIDALTDALFAEANDGPKEPKVRKKARWTDEQKAAAKAEKEAERAAKKAAGVPEPTKEPPSDAPAAAEKKKKDKKKDAVPVVRKLAPEERISGPGNAEEAAKIRETLGFVAPAPAGGFSFGFTGVAPGAQQNGSAPAPPGASPSSSDDTSSSDSDSDAEPAKPAAVPAAPAMPIAASSDDDSSSSDSDDSSTDDEEERKKTPQKAASSDDSSSSDSDSSDSDSEEKKQPTAAPSQQYNAPYPPTSAPATTTAIAPPASGVAVAGVSPLDSEFVPRRVYVGGMPYGYTESDVHGFWEYCGPIESIDLLTFPDTGRFRGIAFITFATEEGYAAALGCDGEPCDGQTVKVQKCKWSAKDRRAAMMAGQQGHVTPGQGPPQEQYNQQYDNIQGMHAAVPPPAAFGAGAPQPPAAAPGTSPWEARQAPAIAAPLRAPAPKIAGYDVAYVGNVAYEADDAALRALFEPFGVTKVRLHTDKDTGRPKGFAHVHFKDEASLDAAMSLDGTQLFGRKIRVGYAQPKKEAPAA